MEAETKEELVVLKNVPEHEGSTAAGGSHEEMEEAILAQDYSQLSRKELVDLLKDLARQNDFRKSEAILKEIRNHYDDLLERDRTEALKKFIEGGGSPDDFVYRGDESDAAFEAIYKVFRDRKTEHFRNLEEQKGDNLKKKTLLLEELRNLIDGEDSKHSFEKFKDIQGQWKQVGPVGATQGRPLWASYHALVDRFYDNRNIYFELKELDRKKNLEAKTELCLRAEKLAEVAKIGEAVRELNELHEEYKHIGPVAREEKEAIWERFKKASGAVYTRRDAFVANLHQELNKNLEQKEHIITEVTTLSAFQSDRIKEWNLKTTEIIGVQKRWEALGAVPRARSREINKRFWGAFKTFFNSKGAFFKKLDESRNKNLVVKRELIRLAEATKSSQDWEKTSNELKALQIKWKEIGPVPEKMREKIFQEFKAACDFFFEQRRSKVEEADKEHSDNLHKKEAICSELERMIEQKTGTLDQLRELQRSFHSIGFVPRQAMASIKTRFSLGMDKFIASLDQVSQEDKDRAMLEIQLENLKTDPDASFKIHQREQVLRKKITKAENDLATLKNNLEFFGRSKNAEKMKAEFSEKINESTRELTELKSQLKILRAAL